MALKNMRPSIDLRNGVMKVLRKIVRHREKEPELFRYTMIKINTATNSSTVFKSKDNISSLNEYRGLFTATKF